jgi:hypothetical protein
MFKLENFFPLPWTTFLSLRSTLVAQNVGFVIELSLKAASASSIVEHSRGAEASMDLCLHFS